MWVDTVVLNFSKNTKNFTMEDLALANPVDYPSLTPKTKSSFARLETM